MKSYYLVYSSMDLDRPDGVEKKIIRQKEMFMENGFNMSFIFLERNNGTFWSYRKDIEDADFIYFRKGTIIDWRFLRFFKKLKQKNPGVVIFMEIPTYPYDGEGSKLLSRKFVRAIDHLCRRFAKKYIDRLVVVNYHEPNLWGIKAINLVNGIDVENVRVRKCREYSKERLTICCIAKFSPWHGYERIIEGLSQYYRGGGKRDIRLLMVGTGDEQKNYLRLVHDKNLNAKVKFYGQLTGDELEEIYDISDVGCGSLGRYKSGIEMSSDLKSREYMAKGMPMICGCKIDVLENKDYPYAIFFPNDESIIDINSVLNFMDRLYNGRNARDIAQEIREFAQENVDMKVTFEEIIGEAKCLL